MYKEHVKAPYLKLFFKIIFELTISSRTTKENEFYIVQRTSKDPVPEACLLKLCLDTLQQHLDDI